LDYTTAHPRWQSRDLSVQWDKFDALIKLNSWIVRSTSMSPDFDTLATQALSLPPEQRFELAQRLWVSVEATIDEDEELFAEIARRDAAVESGAVTPVPYEQAMREIRDSRQ
jgi:putative addiction module component (TIGR02574 family)